MTPQIGEGNRATNRRTKAAVKSRNGEMIESTRSLARVDFAKPVNAGEVSHRLAGDRETLGRTRDASFACEVDAADFA